MAVGANGVINEGRLMLNHVIERLDRIIEATEQQYTLDQFTYIRRILQNPSDVVAQDVIQLPPGVLWKIRRFAVTGGANGQFAVYLNEAQPQNLLDGSFSNAAMDAWAPSGDGLYIPQGNQLVLRFFNQPVNQLCTVNMRVTEIKVAE